MNRKIISALILATAFAMFTSSCGTVDKAPEISEETSMSTSDTASEETTDDTDSSTEETTDSSEETEESSEVSSTEPPVVLTDTPKKPTSPPEEPQTEAAAPTQAPAAPTQAPASGSFDDSDMTFIYGGSQASVLVDAQGLVSALGSPSDVQEAQGCLSNGADQKIYFYSGINVYTYVENGRETIYDIEITSASYPTPKGLAVGMPESEIERLYGTNYTKSGNGYIYYSSSGTYMYITTAGGAVASVEYCADV